MGKIQQQRKSAVVVASLTRTTKSTATISHVQVPCDFCLKICCCCYSFRKNDNYPFRRQKHYAQKSNIFVLSITLLAFHCYSIFIFDFSLLVCALALPTRTRLSDHNWRTVHISSRQTCVSISKVYFPCRSINIEQQRQRGSQNRSMLFNQIPSDADADSLEESSLTEPYSEDSVQKNPNFLSKRQRFLSALPAIINQRNVNDSNNLDEKILKTAIPTMINLAAVPIVNAVDTFWVGQMGSALALAGQAAANQCFFTIFFIINYLPTITAPLVASAVGSGNLEEAQKRVCEALFLCNLFGLIGCLLLAGFPEKVLKLVLSDGAPAVQYAKPYLRYRAVGMIPALISATGFAAFRGSLDTVTPLKVSLGTNLLNLVLDPILIFWSSLRVVGAALATAICEVTSGVTYMILMFRRKLIKWNLVLRPPSFQALVPLLLGSASMLGRQIALNVGFVLAARRAQSLDPSTGVAAAAYGIVMQIYFVFGIMHIAMQSTAAALVPATLAKSGKDDARCVADRIFVWGSILGILLGSVQYIALPYILPLFSMIPEVREAIKIPALISSLLHVANGPVFPGEGIMLGLRCYLDLMLITACGIGIMVGGILSPAGKQVNGILISFLAFCCFQAVAVIIHYLKFGPLSISKRSSIAKE